MIEATTKIIPFTPGHQHKHSFIDLTGKIFGKLTVIQCVGRAYGYNLVWRCLCSCGRETLALGSNLRGGRTNSCTCNQGAAGTRSKMPGVSLHHYQTPEYRSWAGMKGRCSNPNIRNYKNYGGRGIKVCKRWMDFQNFRADMGQRPSPKHSLERIDVNGHYEPGNCRWSTPQEQANNKRSNVFIEINGVRKTLNQWAREKGMWPSTIALRLRQGWAKKDLFKPVRHHAISYWDGYKAAFASPSDAVEDFSI